MAPSLKRNTSLTLNTSSRIAIIIGIPRIRKRSSVTRFEAVGQREVANVKEGFHTLSAWALFRKSFVLGTHAGMICACQVGVTPWAAFCRNAVVHGCPELHQDSLLSSVIIRTRDRTIVFLSCAKPMIQSALPIVCLSVLRDV